MPNTQTLKIQNSGLREVTVYFTDVIDATPDQETNLPIYNAASVLTVLKAAYPGMNLQTAAAGALTRVFASCSSKVTSAGTQPVLTLNFDATTPIVALNIPVNTNATDSCFKEFGGLQNSATGTAGFTGNITLTTSGLLAGDVITIALTVIVAANTLKQVG